MALLTAQNPDTASGKSKDLFNAVHAKFGVVPNMMRTMGNSNAVLEGYLNFSGALSQAKIGGKLGGLIALTVAEANGCDYCLSAHSYIGTNMLHLDEATQVAARTLASIDPKTDAALRFARQLVDTRGRVSTQAVQALKEAGFGEGEITEIIAHTALNIFTNYLNVSVATEIDFPHVTPLEAVVA